MSHQRHSEKEKYRQWAKTGLGFTYLRKGIAPFCDDIAKQHHQDILDNIAHTKNLSAVACDKCSWTTLRPDHAKEGNRSCMLGQRNCNCCDPAGKITCPNKVCGAIYDEIVKSHRFTPPAPYWKNTETQHWCTDSWSIAKCFINGPGYNTKASAADIDCIGLLHYIRNNQYFHNHIQCTIVGTDIFSKVIADRNEILHLSTMELEETEANSYIDDMIAVLQDGKELNSRQDAKNAVKKLEELKENNFIITSEDEAQLLRDFFDDLRDKLDRHENKIQVIREECDRLEKQLSELGSVISELKEIKVTMAHLRHLEKEKEKYRQWQWAKAVHGLTYLREGIAPFCDEIAKEQHKDILDNIAQTKNLSAVACDKCSWTTLIPDHAKGGNIPCTLGQRNCNCCNPAGKSTCPNNVCGAIYDAIVKNHGFTPPVPYWKNTESQHWCTDPWSIAKCFINVPGYDMTASAADTDCIGLLHLIRNNQYFHSRIQCKITQTDMLSKVIADKNEIFHSSAVGLEETEANSYIDDMIAVLQDDKELNSRQDAKNVVMKLEELKKKDFTIISEDEAQLLIDVCSDFRDTLDVHEECDNLEKHIPEPNEELNRLKADALSRRDYEQSKLEFQTRLIEFYKKDILHMSPLPLRAEGNLCDFEDVYLRPKMLTESKDELSQRTEFADVRSMSDIFAKDGKPMKSIYVLGEAGSGKSSFCKSLVHYWCLAHSDGEKGNEDEFNGVREMKKFSFLFFLPLRHYKDKMKIKEMLEESYDHPVLEKLLKHESRTCLIVLDGLDEWTPTDSKCLPERGTLKKYTVLTTSRLRNIATLEKSNVTRQIRLPEFHSETFKKGINEKRVSILNKMFGKDGVSSNCENVLQIMSVASLYRPPCTLQKLFCLRFDCRHPFIFLHDIYTEVRDQIIDWKEKNCSDDCRIKEMTKTPEKPELYLRQTEFWKPYSYIIHDVLRLAYETWFNNTKEKSLSFDSSTFERLEISDEVKTCCLILEILSETKCPSLSASKSQRSVFSFVQIEFQRLLTTFYIAIELNAQIVSSADSGNADLSDKCATFFSKCTTLDEILEQKRLFFMLCYLEPRTVTSISKYIYDIVMTNKYVLEYRRTLDIYTGGPIISNIQNFSLECMEKAKRNPYQHPIQWRFYLGDISVQHGDECVELTRSGTSEKHYISPDSVISYAIDLSRMDILGFKAFYYLKKFKRLQAIKILWIEPGPIALPLWHEKYHKVAKYICKAIEGNTSTLKTLFLTGFGRNFMQVHKTLVRCLPDMRHLVTLICTLDDIQHDDFTALCTFLSGSSQFEQITLYIYCELRHLDCSHILDLSKNKQLQRLESNVLVNFLDAGSTANNLTQLYLRFPVGYPIEYNLRKVLPLLPNLCELSLENFTFTKNIIKCPSKMKSLKTIVLSRVKMSLTTWQQFVDSLPLMPLSVKVEILHVHFTDMLRKMMYVRKQEALFKVESEDDFVFFTKK